MEETQIQVQETLQKTSPKLNLRISRRGDLDLQGDVNSTDLQTILDNSHLRNKLYLEYQKHFDRESNITVLYIGLIFSSLIGLICFCAMNQSPKSSYQQSLGVLNHEFNG